MREATHRRALQTCRRLIVELSERLADTSRPPVDVRLAAHELISERLRSLSLRGRLPLETPIRLRVQDLARRMEHPDPLVQARARAELFALLEDLDAGPAGQTPLQEVPPWPRQ